ncbi:hypothetical protein [Ostreiculturibacter nitratireducens]|uniref:hypothetical protein n=1 Tax=Ostreiculturibacter nitratireducens TaxID=3075226 RepID=UPI0031B5CFAB
MTKTIATSRSTTTGRFSPKPLGKSKAAKFAQVEGITLTAKSKKTLVRLEASGLKGDALRAAITGTFEKKRSG